MAPSMFNRELGRERQADLIRWARRERFAAEAPAADKHRQGPLRLLRFPLWIRSGSRRSPSLAGPDGSAQNQCPVSASANLPPSATGGSAHSPGRFGRVAV
jgi:hypothetical protein